MKRCARCRQEKPPEEFGKRSRSKDGLDSYCKECANAKQREWRKAHPEKCSEYSRRYYYTNWEERKAYNRAYAAAHREYYAAKYKEWADEHREAVRAYQRARRKRRSA